MVLGATRIVCGSVLRLTHILGMLVISKHSALGIGSLNPSFLFAFANELQSK